MKEGGFWKNIGIGKKEEKEITKPTENTVEEAVEKGGISQSKEIENRVAKWTPKQEAAFYFLRSKALIKNIEKENLTKQIVDFVENFEKHPKEVMPSASYNKDTQKFEAAGKVEGYH